LLKKKKNVIIFIQILKKTSYRIQTLHNQTFNMHFQNIILIFLLLFVSKFKAQNTEKQVFKVMSYNVENYFDCKDDSLTNDSEYLPGGMRGWNYDKYTQKQANISKVIAAIGGWEPPALVGLCEIESEKCLWDLTRYSGMKNMKYNFVHFESPDARGVDVALLYQPAQFKPIFKQAINVKFPQSSSRTRDILFVSGTISTGDTLHVFVCHFPSRLGGELESEEKRNFVASVVRLKTDSLFAANANTNIVIMGDFNDYPNNKSMYKILGASKPETPFIKKQLYNLMFPIHEAGKGSHKHNGEWGALDQIIVSGNLLVNDTFKCREAQVFEVDFLLVDDEKFLGKQPFRTYNGMKYQGGFADHLPVYVDFEFTPSP